MEKLVEIMLNEGIDEYTIVNVISNFVNEEDESVEYSNSLSESCFNDIIGLVEGLIYETKARRINNKIYRTAKQQEQFLKEHPEDRKANLFDYSTMSPEFAKLRKRIDMGYAMSHIEPLKKSGNKEELKKQRKHIKSLAAEQNPDKNLPDPFSN